MKKRRVGRKVLQKKRHEKVLRPYNAQTPIRCFIDKTSYSTLETLLKNLHPYLLNQDAKVCDTNKLYFDMVKIKGCHEMIIAKIAEFLNEVEKQNGLKIRKSIFYRYLADPIHCNLKIPETSLKSLITRAIREII